MCFILVRGQRVWDVPLIPTIIPLWPGPLSPLVFALSLQLPATQEPSFFSWPLSLSVPGRCSEETLTFPLLSLCSSNQPLESSIKVLSNLFPPLWPQDSRLIGRSISKCDSWRAGILSISSRWSRKKYRDDSYPFAASSEQSCPIQHTKDPPTLAIHAFTASLISWAPAMAYMRYR